MFSHGIMNNRFFNQCFVQHELAKLNAVYLAIPQWESIALSDVGAQETIDASAMSEDQRHWHAEYINDQ